MLRRLYVYKLTVDNGGAPCVDHRLLTLAICKPMIRTTARVGDVLFGCAANGLSPDNRLIYIARVTSVEDDGDYYEKPEYEHRGDRIYIRGEDGRFRIRPDARYHDNGRLLERDLGSFPEYGRARVLVSDDFRYFGSLPGSHSPDLTPYPHLRRLLATMGQGHRINHPPELECELLQLLESTWRDDPRQSEESASTSPRDTPPHSGPNSLTNRRCG